MMTMVMKGWDGDDDDGVERMGQMMTMVMKGWDSSDDDDGDERVGR